MATFAVQAAVVYKWVDADGVVHFSDQPSPGAEKIFTSSAATARSPAGAATLSQHTIVSAPQAPKRGQSGLGYSDCSVDSPVNDQTFFGEDVVGVHLTLTPSLKSNQSITWHLNGKQLDNSPDAVSFSLPHLDRGTYALTATITDQQTGESQNSNSVTFYVRQPSALAPQHK